MSIIGEIHEDWAIEKTIEIKSRLKEIYEDIDIKNLESCVAGLTRIWVDINKMA